MWIAVSNSLLLSVEPQLAFPNDDDPRLQYSHPTPQQVPEPYRSQRDPSTYPNHPTTLPPINASGNRPRDERLQRNPYGDAPITNRVPEAAFPVLSRNIHPPEFAPPGVDHSFMADLGALVKMAGRLRPSLPVDYLWLGRKDLKVVGTRPIGAGGFADVWVGELDNRKVAIKSYRCSASADYSRICGVSNP